ncbi:hypothetical protein P389DRAFT_208516 [Cystobasidium minutum MCA 4210]|uniref:uncharacterized protein n=1 Tax=Cystobasidium minutum MCA 4210 TaxID=1397322 RepID=UPI0034CFCAB7|eukprot:jgi/Rhomi1/208516/estExt_Genemark1.C_2_t10200
MQRQIVRTALERAIAAAKATAGAGMSTGTSAVRFSGSAANQQWASDVSHYPTATIRLIPSYSGAPVKELHPFQYENLNKVSESLGKIVHIDVSPKGVSEAVWMAKRIESSSQAVLHNALHNVVKKQETTVLLYLRESEDKKLTLAKAGSTGKLPESFLGSTI